MSKTVHSPFGSTNQLSAPVDYRSHLDVSAEIENRAEAMLGVHTHFRGRKRWVRCHFSGGRLHLTGTVPTFYLKQLAQEAIRQLDGVEQVVNQIVVANPFAEPSENRRVARRIERSNGSGRSANVLEDVDLAVRSLNFNLHSH